MRVPDGIWTHDPQWSKHWATGDSAVSKGRIVGIDWNRIASHPIWDRDFSESTFFLEFT